MRHKRNNMRLKAHKAGATRHSTHIPVMLTVALRREANHVGRLAPGLSGAQPELDDAPPAEAAHEREWER